MGYGDEIMASYYAKGAAARGKRIAFGNGTNIIWHRNAEEMFRNNPNVAPPGSESDNDIEWVTHSFRGRRPYNHQFGNRWLWIPGFGDRPGELFFSDEEISWAQAQGAGAVLIEPNVPAFKIVGVNKQWPVERYAEITHHLVKAGHEVIQFYYPPPYGPGRRMQQARQIKTPSFRHALALLSLCSLYIGPEGGLHHGAAALNKKAVVIFGGFISPVITGYAMHTNLFEGKEACGSFYPCQHCRDALDKISVGKVKSAALDLLEPALA